MLPWRHVVEMTRENMSRAALHHNRVLLKCCFHPWLEVTRRVNKERLEAAEALHKRILLRRTWRQWRKVRAATHSTLFFHGFVEFVSTFQTAAILVSCGERKLGRIPIFSHFPEPAAQDPYSQNSSSTVFGLDY